MTLQPEVSESVSRNSAKVAEGDRTGQVGDASPNPTADELRADCLRLIDFLYNHRLNVKLLLAAKYGLQIVARYKANRRKSRQ